MLVFGCWFCVILSTYACESSWVLDDWLEEGQDVVGFPLRDGIVVLITARCICALSFEGSEDAALLVLGEELVYLTVSQFAHFLDGDGWVVGEDGAEGG